MGCPEQQTGANEQIKTHTNTGKLEEDSTCSNPKGL